MSNLLARNISIAVLDFDVKEGDFISINKYGDIFIGIMSDASVFKVWKSAKSGENVYLYTKETDFYIRMPQ